MIALERRRRYTPEEAPPALHDSLPRQLINVALLISNGFCDKQIESLLGITHSTLRIYIDRIRERWKLPKDLNVRVEITRIVVQAWADHEYRATNVRQDGTNG